MDLIAGVDEVGRGPLAGPVIAAAVILNPKFPIRGLKDSKQCTAKKREELSIIIKEKALCYAFGRAEVSEIDQLNIFHASLLAMQRAVAKLTLSPRKVWVDGNFCPDLPYLTKAFIKGDEYIPVISAASIIAKVERDREMIEFDSIYPEYKFAQNKGYPTKEHIEALRTFGISPIHRLSFAPVKEVL